MTPPIAAVDGSPTWRRGIRSALEELGFASVDYPTVADWRPGEGGAGVIVWIDDDDGLSAVADFSERWPLIPLVAVFPRLDLVVAAAAVRAGASGVLDEDDDIDTIGQTVAAALAGRVSLPRELAVAMSDRVPEQAVDEWVTPEQAAWLVALADGVTVADLADRIGWSERETFRMLGDLYRHLGVANRTEAIIWAARHGLVG